MVLEGKSGYDSTPYWVQRHKEEIDKPYTVDKETVDFILANLKSNFHLLDVGCGKGELVPYVQMKIKSYTGIDISEEALKKASADFPDCNFDLINDLDWSFEDEEFDVAVSITVIQHLSLSRAVALLRNAFRVLKPGGTLLLWEGRIIDAPRDVVESIYKSATCAEHMIPKPLSLLKEAAPFVWEGSGLQWVLRKPEKKAVDDKSSSNKSTRVSDLLRKKKDA